VSLNGKNGILNAEQMRSHTISAVENFHHGRMKVDLHNLEVKIAKAVTQKEKVKNWREERRRELRRKIGLE
jgi:hypothetical protein